MNGVIIGLIVNVQQGLPATLTSCLSIAARRMADFNALVRRTEIVETLGAVTVIASDKARSAGRLVPGGPGGPRHSCLVLLGLF